MSDPETPQVRTTAYERLGFEGMSIEFRQRLEAIMNKYEFAKNDVMFEILELMGLHEALTSRMPEAAEDVLRRFRQTAQDEGRKAVVKALAGLNKELASEAREALKDARQGGVNQGRSGGVGWAVAAVSVLAGVCVLGGYWWGSDRTQARMEARLGHDVVVWAATDAGERARELAVDGVIDWLDSDDGEAVLAMRANGELSWALSPEGAAVFALRESGDLEWAVSSAGKYGRAELERIFPGWAVNWIYGVRRMVDVGSLRPLMSCDGVDMDGASWKIVVHEDGLGAVCVAGAGTVRWQIPWRHECAPHEESPLGVEEPASVSVIVSPGRVIERSRSAPAVSGFAVRHHSAPSPKFIGRVRSRPSRPSPTAGRRRFNLRPALFAAPQLSCSRIGSATGIRPRPDVETLLAGWLIAAAIMSSSLAAQSRIVTS